MKNLYFLLLATTIMIACENQANEITIQNNDNLELTDKIVVIPRNQLNNAENNMHPIITSNGDTLLTQLDDLDNDGQWDELVFLVDLAANQEKHLNLKWVEEPINFENHRTNIRFAKKTSEGTYQKLITEKRPQDHTKAKPTVNYQMEGPAWENDKVGFRMYFDPRNGFDIFGKTTEKMVMDQTGINGNYHELQDWGMDILKVNNSLGAGALAMYWQDSLYRLSNTGSARFQLITEGPVRSIFDLIYEGWPINGQKVNVTHRIIIEAGKYFYTSEVLLENTPEAANLATGIVNIKADTVYEKVVKGNQIMATHAPQAFNGEYLGMAIFADQKQVMDIYQAPDLGKGVTQTYALLLKIAAKPVQFHFFAGWELSNPDFASQQDFIDEVEKAISQLEAVPQLSFN